MGLGNLVSGIRNRFKRSEKAGKDEAELAPLEAKVEKRGASVRNELRNFFSGFNEENKLIAKIEWLNAQKYSIVKTSAIRKAAQQNVSIATTNVIGALDRGRRRLQMYTTVGKKAAIAAVGRGLAAQASFSTKSDNKAKAEFNSQMQSWFTEQRNLIQILKNQTLLRIKEMEEEAIAVDPIISKNTEMIRAANTLIGFVGKQNQELMQVKRQLTGNIEFEKRELTAANKSLEEDAQAARANISNA